MIPWAWKRCPSVFRDQIFVAIWSVRTTKCVISLFLFTAARDPRVAWYSLCLEMFNPDDSWDKNHNPEPWNKNDFLLNTSFVTVYYMNSAKWPRLLNEIIPF